ncbi:unnamed protein product [Arctia plantaginis]|uniref:Protein SAAL1 n=1 Tax=Arctia plantaginis TaxID=874455 RepID=A0A8S1ASJ3_ARCPL|nr:unnamed protein product [Arctia plantaginis]
MKPDNETVSGDAENPIQIAGDVIGDTAYSERFVLKILLKLANLNTLKDEINEKSFEDDLCILWDMTAEKDVVLFLQKHDVLKLFHFALPVIEIPRIIEIIVGIIANMCCLRVVVRVLMKMERLLHMVISYISNNDDSLLLVQLLRLVSACLFLANDEELSIWMDIFTSIDYSSALYFILKNSSHKDLLVTALENFNTVCSYCNTEKFQMQFFTYFVTPHALDSLTIALCEITKNHGDECVKEELERVFVISLQIVLNLLGFDKSSEIYNGSTEEALSMINIILLYYENKLNLKEMDTDLFDIVKSTTTIVNILPVNDTCEPSKYLEPTYSMWKTINSIAKSNENGSSFEDNDIEELEEFSENIKPLLSGLICNYIAKCSNENLFKVLDTIGGDYDDIVRLVKDKNLRELVNNRSNSYRSRLEDTIDM